MVQFLKKNRKVLGLFFLCAFVVFFIHFNLYQTVLQYRLFNNTEDWPFLVMFRSLDPNPLAKLWHVWTTMGLHITAQIYHIGILSNFLGYNYPAYQVVNVVLKALGTLSLFPLVVVLFKNKKLAFIATILFAISSATAGSFLWVVKGSEYIGILLMNIFFITYYYTIQKNSKKLLFLSGILVLTSYLMAPPRMFPLIILVPLVEAYWLIRTRKVGNLKYSIIRALVLILPIVLISKPAPVSSMPFTSRPAMIFNDILGGNWQNLLDPFAGIGWSLLTNDFWQFFGTLELTTFTNFSNYFSFLLRPILIFGIITAFLSPVLSKKPGRFFILAFSINFILEILMFFLASHQFLKPENLLHPIDPGRFLYTKYPTLVALYIYTIVFACFLEWRKNQKENKLLQGLWVGPLFSMVFLGSTWVIMGPLVNDLASVHWYFGIPAMGTTLFLAAILVSLYEKFRFHRFAKFFALIIIFWIITVFYQAHGAAITKNYTGVNPEKISLADQELIQGKLISQLSKSASEGNLLVYLDIKGDSVDLRRTTQYDKEALVVINPGYWIHWRRGGDGIIRDGCIAGIIDKDILKSTVESIDNETVFKYMGDCVDRKNLFNNRDFTIYKLNDFYAFEVKDGNFIDIKKQILNELGI